MDAIEAGNPLGSMRLAVVGASTGRVIDNQGALAMIPGLT